MSDSIDINRLNKAFDNRVRLGVMSVLSVNESMDFNSLKALLNLTDGNLASHLMALEKTGYIAVQKLFIGRKPRTIYSITPEGRQAFIDHLSFLEQLIGKTQRP